MTTLQSLLIEWSRGIAACSIAATIVWPAYLIALRLTPTASVAVRLGATAVIAGWLMVAIFWVASAFLAFRLAAILPLLVLLGAMAHLCLTGHAALQRLCEDVRAALAFLRGGTRSPEGWLFLAASGVAVVRILRATVSPPLAWDDLTYHLVKAGRFVQDGGVVGVAAPGAWSYYEYLPPVGDVLWAWAMLPLRSDALMPLVSGLIWIAGLLGAYACARQYGAAAREALLAATAVSSMPAVLTYVGSAYVDNTALAAFVLAALFVVRAGHGAARREILVTGAALGILLGTKLTMLPLVAVAIVALGCFYRNRPRPSLALIIGSGAALAIALPPYARAWFEFGSPIYPMPLTLGGHTVLEGNPIVARFSVDALPSALRLHSSLDFWLFMLFRPGEALAFNAPGPGAILLLLLALVALPIAIRGRSHRGATLFLLSSALAVLGLIATDGMRFVRETINVTTTGRYFTPALAGAAILGTAGPAWMVRVLCVPAVVAGVALSLPISWNGVELVPMIGGAGILLAIAGVSTLGLRRASRGSRPVAPLVITCFVVSLAFVPLATLRDSTRYEIFAAAARREPVFHMHPLNPVFAAAWPLWEALDQPAGHSVAVTAGWEVVGHHWYQYPLFGARLQNRVIYVPVTVEGDIVNPEEMGELRRRASLTAWLTRLVTHNVDYVVSLAPRTTIEDFWMSRLPQIFAAVPADAHGLHAAYRVDRIAAEHALRSQPVRPAGSDRP